MKAILFIIGYSILVSLSIPHTQTGSEKHQDNPRAVPPDSSFALQVMPLLQKKCSPCHFEGGKMYEKMPFDKGSTIIGHDSGIMKRFSDKREKTLIENYIREHDRQG